MVFALTSLVILFVLVVGTAANIQELLKNCTENADCGKNANCRDFYQGCAQKGCACDEGFVASSNNTDCIKVVKDGEACPYGGVQCPQGTCSTGVVPKCFPFIPLEDNCPQDNRTCPSNSECSGGKCQCKAYFLAKGNKCSARLHNEVCNGTYRCLFKIGLKCINEKCQCESGFRWIEFAKWRDGGIGACKKIPGDTCTEDSDCSFQFQFDYKFMVCSNTSKCICDPVNYPIYVPEIQLCLPNGSSILNIGDEHCSSFMPNTKLQSCNVNNGLMCKMCPGEGNYRCVSELNKTNLSACSEATSQCVPAVILIWLSLLTLQVL